MPDTDYGLTTPLSRLIAAHIVARRIKRIEEGEPPPPWWPARWEQKSFISTSSSGLYSALYPPPCGSSCCLVGEMILLGLITDLVLKNDIVTGSTVLSSSGLGFFSRRQRVFGSVEAWDEIVDAYNIVEDLVSTTKRYIYTELEKEWIQATDNLT